MASLSVLWIAMAIIALGQAAPTLNFPINAQVPPVARIAQQFSFVFSPITFTSQSAITYTLSNPPNWLSIDSSGRRLYGTPQDGDVAQGEVVGVPIELVATDNSGSTTMSSTLVVCRNAGPQIQVPLSEQISSFGNTSSPSSIISYPDRPFSFAFAKNTFSKPDLNYYAVSGDNAPLPSWITFDVSNLAFKGTTPPLSSLVEPPQTFGFQLVASDIVGFAGVAIPFSIVVGNREISTGSSTLVQLNATAGAPLTYTGLQQNVKIDGKIATSADIASIETPGIPSWLSFDKSSWVISGTPPAGATDTSFAIIFSDTYSNTLNVTVEVAMISDLFLDALPGISIEPGKSFTYNIGTHLRQPSDVDVTVQSEPSQDWIKFDAKSMTLSGDAPSSLQLSQIKVSVQAKSKSSSQTGTETLTMQVVGSTRTSSTATATPTSSATSGTSSSSSSPTSEPSQDKGSKSTSTRTILLAVLIPLLLLLLALIAILLCLCRRRRQKQKQAVERKDISGPVPGSFVYTSGSSEAASSMHEVNRHYDLGRQGPGADTTGLAISTGPNNLRRSLSHQDIPPVPPLPIGTARSATMRSFSEGNISERGSWATTAVMPQSLSRAQRTQSRSELSDMSLYEDMSDANSMILLGNGSRDTSFRDGLEVNVPVMEPATSSIQHTPDMAYGDSPAPLSLKSVGARHENSPFASSEALPTRPASRLGPQGPRDLEQQPPPKPWMKGHAAKLMSNLKHSKLANATTVDTFADKTAGRNGDEQDSILARPRPLRIVDKSTISRPVSRRGEGDVGGFFGGSQRHRPQHGPYSGQLPPPPEDEVPEIPPLSTARLSRQRLARGDTMATTTTDSLSVPVTRRNPFDISYEDLVSNSPFHPSRTWTTVASGEEMGSARDGTSGGSASEPNWTVVVESPTATALMSASGTGSDESGRPFGGSQGSGKWMASGRAPLAEVQVTSPRTMSSSVGGSGKPGSRHSRPSNNNMLGDDEGYHENEYLEKLASSRSGSIDRLSEEDEDFAVYI
ncbi:uncharacterized protein E0L32_000055 [Thyridium curvatum]|uniref:Dystroglycan-type cadherin-like domain-containing protein n=1 Tax=Thyridium curvatum TaxID=1093900 RepID=A0A507BFH9_9PEZI|nr:uncharacterized protein E0L32_000055 [Thyridium curvatum]TPX15721.1 hypothetical protein E0L32_000055 [Thyridium curvatum]